MNENDFKSKFKLSSDVLQNLFENGKSPLSGQFLRWKLWAHWSQYVGESLALQTEPVGYHNGLLVIWVKSSSWMQELQFVKNEIVDSINAKLQINYVRNIRFTLDRRDVPSEDTPKFQLKKNIQKFK